MKEEPIYMDISILFICAQSYSQRYQIFLIRNIECQSHLKLHLSSSSTQTVTVLLSIAKLHMNFIRCLGIILNYCDK